MARFIKHDKETLGKGPGFLKFTGTKKVKDTTILVTEYDNSEIHHKTIKDLNEITVKKGSKLFSWINVEGLHDEELIGKLGDIFKIDPLALEDVLNVKQRPKFEEFDSFSMISMKMLQLHESNETIVHQQYSIIFGENFLLSFQEEPVNIFAPVVERLKNKNSKIRNRNSDYLAYALVDTIVDHYIYILEYFGELIEGLDVNLLDPSKANDVFTDVYEFKREINYLRKIVRPVRECVVGFIKSENGLVSKENRPFLTDLLDHVTHSMETVEVYRDLLTDQLNFYNSQTNYRLNDIMQTLTIFSVFFIPLTFVAGIYGTNFEFMPELNYRYGYLLFWVGLIAISTGMYFYFKGKKWL